MNPERAAERWLMVCLTTGERRHRVLGQRWFASTFVLLTLVAAGCLPLLVSDEGPDPFPDATLQFLEGRGATRDDVLDQLGEPDWRFDEYRVFVYEKSRYLGKLFLTFPGGATAGPIPRREPIDLYVAFDAHEQVVAHSLPELPSIYSMSFKSIRDRVEKWAKKEHLERIDLVFVVPPGQSGVVFYRPGGFSDSSSFHAWILIDGVPIAEVPEGAYLPILIEPGEHDVQVIPITISFTPEADSKRSIEASIATGPDETVYLWLKIVVPSDANLEKRPEPEAKKALGKLGLISPPPAYAGW
jgi:hypothetical protein